MGLKKYKATVTFLSSVLAPKRALSSVSFEVHSFQPLQGVEDLVFLKGLAAVPANSHITAVELVEVKSEPQAVAA
jgi:hypothetical protein